MSADLRLFSQCCCLTGSVKLGHGVICCLPAQRNHPLVAMALRGCLTLFLILLSGIVYAKKMTTPPFATEEPSTSKIPFVTEEPSTSEIPLVTQIPMTDFPINTHASTTTATPTTSLALVTTPVPATTHHSTTNATTEVPTTSDHTTANATTEAPTTTHHNTTNATTEAPTTTDHTTANSTTEAPTTEHTNATTAPTPPPTTPPVPNPTVGNYSIRLYANSSACLLAKMGLQFSFKTSVNASLQTINLDPNVTTANGTCGSGGNSSTLILKSEKTTVQFVFTNVSEKFHLHALMLSIDFGNGSFFNESNTNLTLWEASVGSSYMCKKEQSYNISDKLTINTFELQVQPFAVQKDSFSTAHECSMDDTSLLIPIIVGAALAGLIFIVVIAYVIGRRRTYVGYQTL
ncbi:lysosome-associated membrane glycoprotein 2-like isoform X2 [Myxocyprinus asiaticus]|uniref:lysosome-associated membrane glycoprotein 2-like isoform X2 n=1 Tax=Myxocyprinus asiaticus TaxID=70543 RepID=UPI002223BECE|nr:lysosome-associated membrane glycoprotein 2-like isoform X2 [Myxocyprinus asiaticus]